MHIGKSIMMAFLLFGCVASATEQTPPTACSDPAYRAFDFWLGEWQVHAANGKLAGTNTITAEYDGCVIHERYETSRAYRGESLNTYDAARDVWHQTWVDSSGLLLLLEGGIEAGSMVLRGETMRDDGSKRQHRISWMPNDDGSVRQFWQIKDAGDDWQVAFDGLYTRRD